MATQADEPSVRDGLRRWVLTVVVAAVAALFLFLGVYQDPEWGDHYLFIKHRPSFRFYFSTPAGEDRERSSLSPRERRREEIFEEFVGKKRGAFYLGF